MEAGPHPQEDVDLMEQRQYQGQGPDQPPLRWLALRSRVCSGSCRSFSAGQHPISALLDSRFKTKHEKVTVKNLVESILHHFFFSLTDNKTWSCSIWSRCIALSGKNVSLLEMLPLHTCLQEILLNYYSPILIKYMTKQQKHTIDILIQNTVFQCLPKSIFDIINYLLLRGHYDFKNVSI